MKSIATATLNGIDISHWQSPVNLDWQILKEVDKIDFAIIKASDGRNTLIQDPEAVNHVTGAKSSDMAIGFYHYGQIDFNNYSLDEAEEEARFFAESIQSIMNSNGLSGYGDIYPVLDLETPPPNDDGSPSVAKDILSTQMILDWARHFCEHFKSLTGRTVMIYTGVTWYVQTYDNFFGEKNPLKNYPLWAADYEIYWGTNKTEVGDAGGWKGWHIHQYSSTGRLSGYANGTMDIDLDRAVPLKYLTELDLTEPEPPTTKERSIFILNKHEQLIAVLSNENPKACPYYDAVHTEEINGLTAFEFSVPAHHNDAQYIREENLVAIMDLDGVFQLFVIRLTEEIHEDETLIKHVTCEHAATELIDEIVEDKRPENQSAEQVLEDILMNTRWDVGKVEYLGLQSTNFYYQSVLSAINSILEIWGGEVRFRINIVGGRITGRYVDIFQKRGNDTGKRFEYSRSISKVTRQADSMEVKTALYGRGKGEEAGDGYGRRLTFADIEWKRSNGDPVDKPLGQEWIGDPNAAYWWGRHNPDGSHRHRFGVFVDDEETDKTSLIWKTWIALQKVNAPKVQYDVNVIDLEQLTGYEHEKVRLGDTVKVLDREFQPPVTLTARVIGIKRVLNEPDKTEVTIGNFIPSLDTKLAKIDKIESTLEKAAPNWDVKIGRNEQIDALRNEIRAGAGTVNLTEDNGILITDREVNPTKALRLLGGIFAIASGKDPITEDWAWTTFGTGEGFFADVITAGTMLFDRLKGGTLTLGGASNGNGRMTVYNDAGEAIADLDAAYGGFTSLTIGDLKTNTAMLSNNSENTIVYLVDPTNGNDANDGLSNVSAFKRLQHAINMIPKNNNGRVEIYIINQQTVNEHDIIIEGFFGTGTIYLDMASSTINGMVWVRNNNQYITIRNGTINQVFGTQYIGDGTVSCRYSDYLTLYAVKIYSRSNVDYGVLARGSRVIIDTCELYGATTAAIEAEYGALVDIIGPCKGTGRAGLRGVGASIISVHNVSVPDGNISENMGIPELYYGAQVVGTVASYDKGVAATPSAPPTTKTWDEYKTRSWNTKSGWKSSSDEQIYQGQYLTSDGTLTGNYKGCFWFDPTDVPNTLAGKTILGIRIKLYRQDSGGWSSDRSIYIWTLNATSSIIGGGEPVVQTYLGSPRKYGWGDSGWFDLPVWVGEALRDGSIKGFCLYTSDASDNGKYMRFDDNAKLEITYQ